MNEFHILSLILILICIIIIIYIIIYFTLYIDGTLQMLSIILEVRLQPFIDSFCKAVQDANNPSKTPTLASQFDKSKYLPRISEGTSCKQSTFFQVYNLANNYPTRAIIIRY